MVTPLYTHREGKVVLTGENAVRPETAHRIAIRHMEAATRHLTAMRWTDASRAMECATEAMNAVAEAHAWQRVHLSSPDIEAALAGERIGGHP